MRISGATFDFYDDFRGEVFRSIYGSPEEVSDTIKTAHMLSPEEREALPDDVFALILQDGERQLRKMACTDPGNTELAVRYFQKVAHRLPLDAQMQVAQNLSIWCEQYGLEELAKEAGILGMAAKATGKAALNNPLAAMTLPAQVKGLRQEVSQNMGAMKAMGAGGKIVTPHQLQHAKMAEAIGTPAMPISALPRSPDKKPLANAVKTAMNPYVDVTDRAPFQAPVREKTASRYALGASYPLDDYQQVKTASRYFDEYLGELTPDERRTYAQNLVKRAEELGLEVGHMALKYASDKAASAEHISSALSTRFQYCDERSADVLRAIIDGVKVAGVEDAEMFLEVVREFDRQAGMPQQVIDPYLSVLKVASAEPVQESASDRRLRAARAVRA